MSIYREVRLVEDNRRGVCSPDLFVITSVSLFFFFLKERQQSKSVMQSTSFCQRCGLAEVNEIFKSKRRENKSVADIKVSAYTHCSNLFTWDGGKALGEVWPGSCFCTRRSRENMCCLAWQCQHTVEGC